MVKNIIKTVIIAVPLISFSVFAGLYKGLDEEGNVIYSDRPFENAQEFTLPSLSVVDAPKSRPPEEKPVEETKPVQFKYTDFDIVTPANNETIWNNPDINVSLQLKPALNTEAGHTIWLSVDNKPLVKDSQNLSLQIGRLDRGAHQLQGEVRDENGKIVARTRAIIVHVKHHTISNN